MNISKYFISDKIIEITCNVNGEKKIKPFNSTIGETIFNHSNTRFSNKNIENVIKIAVRNLLHQATKLSRTSVTLPVFYYNQGKMSIRDSFNIMLEEIISAVGYNEYPKHVILALPEKPKNLFATCEKIATEMLGCLAKKTFKNPYPASDIIITKNNGIVLIHRKNFPFGWAIPGGFIDYGESAETAAIREAKEETGLDVRNLKLFGVFSKPGRDPRFHTISIVFTADGKGKIKAGDDACKAKIFYKNALPEDIAFDHKKILAQFFNRLIKTNDGA